METITTIAGIVALIVGVVEVMKMAGLPSRFAPLASLLLGLCMTIYLSGVNPLAIFDGIVAGLTASGLWSGTKATFKPSQEIPE